MADQKMESAIIEAAVKRTVVALKLAMAADGIDGAPRLLDVIMPNGKRLADCTADDCREFGRLCSEVGDKLTAEGR